MVKKANKFILALSILLSPLLLPAEPFADNNVPLSHAISVLTQQVDGVLLKAEYKNGHYEIHFLHSDGTGSKAFLVAGLDDFSIEGAFVKRDVGDDTHTNSGVKGGNVTYVYQDLGQDLGQTLGQDLSGETGKFEADCSL